MISSHVLNRFVTDEGRAPTFRESTDVLQEIFGLLDRRSCLSVASSCKKFKGPALDQLWSEITSLAAPLGLMDELINTGNGLMFRNGLGRVDWPNYWSYANRVRAVRITDEPCSQAGKFPINPQTLLHALAATTSQIGHGALFPKATLLAFDFHQPSGPAVLLPLIGPALPP
ncbi:hypothetical protein FRC00_006659 [Tulasnella sp. 408]|nr:hypothetical protein FRC00_006659 [Tulasnella sp. 408]